MARLASVPLRRAEHFKEENREEQEQDDPESEQTENDGETPTKVLSVSPR